MSVLPPRRKTRDSHGRPIINMDIRVPDTVALDDLPRVMTPAIAKAIAKAMLRITPEPFKPADDFDAQFEIANNDPEYFERGIDPNDLRELLVGTSRRVTYATVVMMIHQYFAQVESNWKVFVHPHTTWARGHRRHPNRGMAKHRRALLMLSKQCPIDPHTLTFQIEIDIHEIADVGWKHIGGALKHCVTAAREQFKQHTVPY